MQKLTDILTMAAAISSLLFTAFTTLRLILCGQHIFYIVCFVAMTYAAGVWVNAQYNEMKGGEK